MNLNFLNGNYIDFLILILLIYYISEAFRVGFWILMSDFISFLISLLVALRFYGFFAEILVSNFNLTSSLAKPIGFLFTAFISEALLAFLLAKIVKKIPYKLWKNEINKIAGIIPAVGEGLVLTSFILMLAVSLPLAVNIKKDITESKIGGFLIVKTAGIEKSVNQIFGDILDDTLTYLTVNNKQGEEVALQHQEIALSVDESSENQMLLLVNKERVNFGVGELVSDDTLKLVSRAYATDMWERKYFSHYSPEGEDVGDRLEFVKYEFISAGENLALAPTVMTAHLGLMNSEGHRKNILDGGFDRIGIGVIDNGIYGKIFVQVFSD